MRKRWAAKSCEQIKLSDDNLTKNCDANFILNAKKKKKNLQKPFISNFFGHKEGISSLEIHPTNSNLFFSGSVDGNIRFWFSHRENSIVSFSGHNKKILGLTSDYLGKELLSCCGDESIGRWNVTEPKKKSILFHAKKQTFTCIKTLPTSFFFVTGGQELILWDQSSFQPIQKLAWSLSPISKIEINPREPNVLTSLCSDRSIVLYDLRLKIPIKKFFLEMMNNDVSWNTTKPCEFIVANEDSNIYSFDMRNLTKVQKVYKDHVMAVNCIQYNQKNSSFISGSSDATIRIFDDGLSSASDIFFTERMKRIFDIRFLHDGNFILTGSDDGNLRIWERKKISLARSNFSGKNKEAKRNEFLNYFGCNEILRSKTFFLPKIIKNLQNLHSRLLIKKKKKNLKTQEHFSPGYLKFGHENIYKCS